MTCSFGAPAQCWGAAPPRQQQAQPAHNPQPRQHCWDWHESGNVIPSPFCLSSQEVTRLSQIQAGKSCARLLLSKTIKSVNKFLALRRNQNCTVVKKTGFPLQTGYEEQFWWSWLVLKFGTSCRTSTTATAALHWQSSPHPYCSETQQ